ncbi:MAG: amidohydrolase family protein [Sphingomicrobium sp.]
MALLGLVGITTPAHGREPIIDMHLHARAVSGPGAPPLCTPFEVMPRWNQTKPLPEGLEDNRPPCAKPVAPAATTEQAMIQTIEVMNRRNIIGMVSGEPALMKLWLRAAPDRIIPGSDLRLPGTPGHNHTAPRSIDELRKLHAGGELKVLGEVMAQYEGVDANDPRLEPYFALAEELDIPVAFHLGTGEPGTPYGPDPAYRAGAGSPLQLEPVLLRHPKMRIYVMHAGYPFAADMRALMFSHPQVYVDVGSIVYAEPRPAFYRFLQEIVEAGYGDRVLFGSDQMIWPGVIEPAIESIQNAPFLSEQQKRDILYNNAARFLRLSPEEIARHHAM